MRKLIAALVVVGNLIFSSVVDAEIISYKTTGNDSENKFETQEVVKLRALDKAIKIATEQAKVDFKNKFSGELSDEEISAIINNGYELGEVNYTQADSSWQAEIELKIDDAEVKNWIRRFDREKFTLISQNRDVEKLFAANDKRTAELRERLATDYKKQDKKFFKGEFDYVSNEFLSNNKVAEGNKFFYRGRLDDAITLYTEAIKINEYNEVAYNLRGNIYNIQSMSQKDIPIAEDKRRQSINDLDKSIRLNNNYASAFSNRGFVYLNVKLFGQAIKDFNRAIQLEPNEAQNYVYRAQCNRSTDKNLAISDFNKAVELAPKNSYVYVARGNFYEQDLKDFSNALADYTRAIELERRENELALYYYNRGGIYQKINDYSRAIDDYTRGITIINNSGQNNPLLAWVYMKRGECYKNLGNNGQYQADLKKFEELQRR